MSDAAKVAFITGGNRGLGFETARLLGKQGITVILGSRELKKGEEAAAKLRGEGAKSVEAVRFDVTKPADHKEIYDYIAKKYGKLDILVNNAGSDGRGREGGSEQAFNSVISVSQENLRKTFETNFFQLIDLTTTLLPLIRKSPAGRIVNLSSVLGSLTLHSDPKSPIYDEEEFCVRRVEDGVERVYRASGAGIARHTDQSEFGASGLGEDGDGRRRGADGIE